jgi:hypothetical protein
MKNEGMAEVVAWIKDISGFLLQYVITAALTSSSLKTLIALSLLSNTDAPFNPLIYPLSQ